MALRQEKEFLGERQECRLGRFVIQYGRFCESKWPPANQTHQVLRSLANSEILFRKRPPRGIQSIVKLTGPRPERRRILFAATCIFVFKNDRIAADFIWRWQGIVIGRFGLGFPLGYYRRNAIKVDLNDLMSTDKIFDVLGCGGTPHMHLLGKKSTCDI